MLIPICVQDESKARRIPGCWRGASEAHIRSDLQRASNEAGSPEDKRIRLILNANWNQLEFCLAAFALPGQTVSAVTNRRCSRLRRSKNQQAAASKHW
jgi:hypothetical protein